MWRRLLFYLNSNPIILRSSWEISLFKGQHGEHLAINVSRSTVMHELFCNCALVQYLFSYPSKSFNSPLGKKMFSLSGSSWYINEGGQGGLVKGFMNSSFAFQNSQNKIIVIIDLWSQPPVCSYKFPREASCRWAWVHWSMFTGSYI